MNITSEKNRTCGNCCFGIKDMKSLGNVVTCVMSSKKTIHFTTTTARELKCKHHLYRKTQEPAANAAVFKEITK